MKNPFSFHAEEDNHMAKETKSAKETAKEAVKNVQETAVRLEKAAEEAAAEVKEKATKTTKAAAKSVKTAEAKAKDTAAKTGKAAAKSVKTAEAKAEETVKAAEVAVKKAAPRKAVRETVYLQYMGKEINKDDIIDKVKKIWTDEMGRKASEIKEITLYLKTDDNAAYYVINGDATGKIDL